MCSHLFYLLFFFVPGEPFLTFWEQWDLLFILVFEVFSHFEVEGAVSVQNPDWCILS